MIAEIQRKRLDIVIIMLVTHLLVSLFNHYANISFDIHVFEVLQLKYSFFVFSNLFGKQSVLVICQILKWFLRRKQQEKQDTGFVSRENMTNMQWLCCKQAINRDIWRCRSQWTFKLGRLESSTLFHLSMDYLFFNSIIYCRPVLFHICLENILKS